MTLTPPSEFNITITMNSDWHIGSGASRGEIDSAVQRDRDDLPYIPAKTLNGILRDGCEQVAYALDDRNSQGKWQHWVNFLFGNQPALADREQAEIDPYPAFVFIHSAVFDESFRKALKGKPDLKSAIAFMKAGVKICPETGSAMPDHLRFEEVVRQGAILTSKQCGFNFDDGIPVSEEQQKTAYALLIAGTKMIEHIGGKRRRGHGNCRITIDSQSEEWLQWLQNNINQLPDCPQWKKQNLASSDLNLPDQESETWWTIPLTITAKSPLVLPKRTVGNVVECLDYIPGRYFLRYLHKKFDHLLDVKSAIDPKGHQIKDLIAQGNLIITNATINIDDRAGRPTPLCLFSDKLSGGLSQGQGVYNRFQEAEPKEIQLQGERAGYLGEFDPASNQLPKHQTVKLELYTHNTIDDRVQRPTQEIGGGIYSYQAIPAETTFKAELRLPNAIKTYLDSSSENWWEQLNGSTRIGQSKKDQYGGIDITPHPPEKCQLQADIKSSSELYVWLLSDVVLRDQRLKPTTDPDEVRKELETQLEITLKERDDEELLSLMARSRRTESWQVRWGLPRPSMLGLQAGSCFVYEIKGDKPTPEKLAELEARGIGERRVEGYGQICFNDPLLMKELSKRDRKESDSNPNSPEPPSIPRSDSSFNYARLIETAAWREAIQNQALTLAADASTRTRILGITIEGENSYPSMSQLGGLRSNLRQLQSLPDQTQVTSWITALENVSNRREKWDKTDNGLQKIRELVTNPQKIWQELNISSLDQLTITVGGCNELKQTLWAEAVRTLVDAMIRAHKRDLEKAQTQKNENGEAA
ncbi:MAG: RAMP superfamily CRISPR-associated protein [Halothece sp.]